jgi:hypothetical protein
MTLHIKWSFLAGCTALLWGAAAAAPAAAQPRPLCCAEPPSSMVGWWTFDEAVGPTAADIAGTPQNGTHTGAPQVVPGKVLRALQFTGTQYVQVASAPPLQFDRGDFSFDAWLRLRDGSGVTSILDKRTLTGGQVRGYHVFVSNGRLGLQLADGAFTNYGSNAVLPVGQWVHIAITVDRDSPTGIRFYYNGVAVGTTGNPMPRSGSLNSPAPLRIGGHSQTANGGLRGQLDEVELFDRVLWPSEIMTVVRADSLGKCRGACGPLDVSLSSAPAQWRVVSVPGPATMPPNNQPVVVGQPPSVWQTSGTGPWVSASTAPDGSAAAGWYEYEYTFCLCPGFSNPQLRLSLRVDDSYQLLLNGNPLPAVPAGFAQPAPGVVVVTSGFQPGNNVLRLRVNNAMGPTGFALGGVLTALAGRCPS